MADWYVNMDGEEMGPYSIEVLKQLADGKQLVPSHLVWTAGMDDWISASEVSDLRGHGDISKIKVKKMVHPSPSMQGPPAPLYGALFCKNCGSQIPYNAVVCVNCGVGTDNYKADNFKKTSEVSTGTLTAGYFFSFFMPFIGGIFGIYVMTKGKVVHGIVMLALALFMFYFWLAFMEAF